MQHPTELALVRQADRLFAAAGIPIEQGFQWVPAQRLLSAYHPTVEVELPLFITGIATAQGQIAQGQTAQGQTAQWQHLCTMLANAYPAEHGVSILRVGAEQQILAHTVSLRELKWALFENSSSGKRETYRFQANHTVAAAQPAPPTGTSESIALCLPPLPAGSSFSALQAIVAHLRSPAGCPWDREQTLRSMRHDLLGECVEVMEAIDREVDGTDNGAHIAEELGDLFMAGVLTLQIAIDEGRFQLADAMQSIVSKLIRRHPHVFGDLELRTNEELLKNWDAIKAAEKRAKGEPVSHPLDGIPAALPALEKARELQSKAQKANLLDRAQTAATLNEKFAALAPALEGGTVDEVDLGVLLWTVVAAAHAAGINAEDALRSYCVQFRARKMAESQM